MRETSKHNSYHIKTINTLLLIGKDSELRNALDSIDAQAQAELERQHVPGLSIAIVHDKQIIWSKGYGFADLERRIPATTKTVYRIASITKLFTATMLMILRDAGKLYLDEPVDKYLNSFKIKSRYGSSSVTFRQIASHIAGLPGETPVNSFQKLRFAGIDDVIANLKDLEMTYPPFYKYKYSNLGYAIMGHVLSIVAEEPYRTFVERRILRPLGMNNTGFNPEDPNIKSLLATGYDTISRISPEPVPFAQLNSYMVAGGLYSNVEDLSRFISFQFNDTDDIDRVGEPQKILKSATLREMKTPVHLGQKWLDGVAIAWHVFRIKDETYVRHIGMFVGFSGDLTLVPDVKLGVVVLANGLAHMDQLSDRCLEILVPIVKSIISKQNKRKVISKLPQGWEKYVGRYRVKYAGYYEVRINNDMLVLVDSMSPEVEATLTASGTNTFLVNGGDNDGEFIVFELGKDDCAARIRSSGEYFERIKE